MGVYKQCTHGCQAKNEMCATISVCNRKRDFYNTAHICVIISWSHDHNGYTTSQKFIHSFKI